MSFIVSTLGPPSALHTRSSATSNSSSGSPALNLIAAFASAGLELYNPTSLRIDRYGTAVVGRGQYSVVDIGQTYYGQQVAVKRSRLLRHPLPEDEEHAFEDSLNQISLELCILSHELLKNHANIVKLLGACIDNNSQLPSLGVVVEFSSFGTLRSFLQAHESTILWDSCFDLAHQVISGLDELHQLRICHGDVKMENTLVFNESGKWIVKLSDFGQSVVAAQDDPNALSGFPYGTPLYNAREVRNHTVFEANSFGMNDALATDIFSFGLLAWEILKKGECFFERSWITSDGALPHLENMLSHIEVLAPGVLLELCLAFVARLGLQSDKHKRICAVFAACLPDLPDKRKTSSTVKAILNDDRVPEYVSINPLCDKPDWRSCPMDGHRNPALDDIPSPVVMWTFRQSLQDVKISLAHLILYRS